MWVLEAWNEKIGETSLSWNNYIHTKMLRGSYKLNSSIDAIVGNQYRWNTEFKTTRHVWILRSKLHSCSSIPQIVFIGIKEI